MSKPLFENLKFEKTPNDNPRKWVRDTLTRLAKKRRKNTAKLLVRDWHREAVADFIKDLVKWLYRGIAGFSRSIRTARHEFSACSNNVGKLALKRRAILLRKKFKTWKKKPRHHLEISIKLSWTKILILLILGWWLWPNSPHVVADPGHPPQPTLQTVKKPLKKHKRLDTVYVAPKPKPVARTAVRGSHTDWLRAAGVPSSVWPCAERLIMRESGWRVNATNPSSGAYGLPQSLPGYKMASAGADWQTNPITQLKWANGYVQKYGGWCGADSFQWANHWY